MEPDANQEEKALSAINSILGGDKSKMKVLFDLFGGQIFSLALNYLGDKEDAEDALQEIFLKVYKNLSSFKLGHRVFPWIYTIAVNTLKNLVRKKKPLQGSLSLENILIEPSIQDEDLVLKNEEMTKIHQALGNLPIKYREVLILYYFQGMNVRSIANLLQKGEEDIKSKLYRGRKKIREYYATKKD